MNDTTGGSGSNPNRGKVQPSDLPSRADSAASPVHRILLIEDSPADIFLIREAIGSSMEAEIQVLNDGEAAVSFFDSADADSSVQCPELVVLDINLPRRNGAQVLAYMRKTRRCSGALVLIVTSSDSAADREAMRKHGADAYFRKPSSYAEFMKLGQVASGLLAQEPGSGNVS